MAPMQYVSANTKLHIEAAITIVPIKPTDPREPQKILKENNGISPGIFRRRLHMIFYHTKASDDDSGWIMAAWMKESLGRVMAEHPFFSGRVRRVDGGGDGGIEIVPNDSGVRLFETSIPVGMEEFLGLENRENVEAQLVYWEDIDDQNPQFSPLFYIQITNFKCGSYSIGLSCSLILAADPLVMINFLNRWTNIHNNISTKPESPKIPMFYSPNIGKADPSRGYYANTSVSTKCNVQNFLFQFTPQHFSLDFYKTLATSCVKKVEQKLGINMARNICLMVKERSKDGITTMNWSKKELFGGNSCEFASTSWDALGVNGSICFNVGNKPVCVSCWINSFVEEDLVIVVPSSHEGNFGMLYVVTVTDDIV